MYVNELLGPEMLDLRCLLMDDLWVQRSQKSKLQKIHGCQVEGQYVFALLAADSLTGIC